MIPLSRALGDRSNQLPQELKCVPTGVFEGKERRREKEEEGRGAYIDSGHASEKW